MANMNSIGEYIRQQREQAKISLRQLATLAGVSNPYLSQIERGLRRPSAEILQQIAKGLKISAETLYVRAGILDPQHQEGLEHAILSDSRLTRAQKDAMLSVYQSFVGTHVPEDTSNSASEDPLDDLDEPESEKGAPQ